MYRGGERECRKRRFLTERTFITTMQSFVTFGSPWCKGGSVMDEQGGKKEKHKKEYKFEEQREEKKCKGEEGAVYIGKAPGEEVIKKT